tara:strand:+ start:1179 stop:1328 length:150 start_codon:yes stop_codon:yes gene_type:complete
MVLVSGNCPFCGNVLAVTYPTIPGYTGILYQRGCVGCDYLIITRKPKTK